LLLTFTEQMMQGYTDLGISRRNVYMSKPTTKQLEPARSVVTKLGGVRATARILSIAPSAVSRWMAERDNKGTGGVVPQKHWKALLFFAKKEKIKLSESDLYFID
jgi:hypothetical protein